MKKTIYLFVLVLIGFTACKQGSETKQKDTIPIQEQADGKLFIIGGGSQPPSLVKSMVEASGADTTGYAVILPMSSSVPDTSAYYAAKRFRKAGVDDIVTYNIQDASATSNARLDSLKSAQLIYMTGGDQRRFMDIVRGTKVQEAIRKAFLEGATVSGSSAGAAVMSKKMITGDEKKHPEYTGDFRTIEADNMIIKEGVGLLENMIVDQHFIRRMRTNRLLSVVIENPGYMGVGIDESTAILVQDNKAEVFGESQIIVISNPNGEVRQKDGLLAAEDLSLDVYVPGETFFLD
ncbi:MAG: cyanophycinase [Bacteroidales bacterium]|nr:cyanophycinase [Bacteroidales bacterium]MCF8336867.1 cyanophycinase [Bacteroidales bacterium]